MDRGRYTPETFSTTQSDELKNWLDNVVLGDDGSMTLDSGASFTIGTTQWSSGDGIDSSLIDHDATTNFVANEHIDWTNAEAQSIVCDQITANADIFATSGEVRADQIGDGTASISGGAGTGFTSLEVDNIEFNGNTINTAVGNLILTSDNAAVDVTGTLDITGVTTWSGGGSANANTAYTHANGSTGADHTWLDQSVISGATPTFGADNFSDGGGNAIVTTTQETNWDNHIADNSQAHTDYLLNNASDSTSGTITAAGLDTDVFTSADKRQPFFLTATVTSGAAVTIYNSNAPIAFDIVFASWLGTVTGSGGLVDLKDGAAGDVILSLSGGEDVVDITSSTAIDVTYNSVAANGSLVVEPQGKSPDMSGIMVITCVPT